MSDDEQKRSGKPRTRGVYEYPKGSGVWWVCYFDEHGRRHRESVGAKGLAGDVYRKRKTEVKERRFFPERIRRRDVSLVDAIDAYVRALEGRSRSLRNWKRYAQLWKDALAKRTTLRDVTPGDVERQATQRRTEGLSPASVNRELTFLRSVYNRAIKHGDFDARNPVRADFFFREDNQHVRFLSDDEESRLHKAIGDDEWPKIAFSLYTGFRQGNQFRLKWADVNFDAGVIRARQTKSGRDYAVPINDALRTMLRALPSRLRSSYVFPSESGETPLDPKNYLHRVFYPALKEAHIADFRWHDMRHTFASRLVMAGVDIRTVQELMGHQTLTMTMRYAHLSPGHRLDAVQRLNPAPTAIATATSPEPAKVAAEGGGQVVELAPEPNEPCWDRTSDPLLKSWKVFWPRTRARAAFFRGHCRLLTALLTARPTERCATSFAETGGQSIGGCRVPLPDPAAVHVDRQLDRCVPQLRLDPLRLLPRKEMQRGERVSKRMRGEVLRQLRLLEHALEVPRDVPLRVRRPVAGREHPGRHRPPTTRHGEGWPLRLHVEQDDHEIGGEIDGPLASHLREARLGVEHAAFLTEAPPN